MNLTAIILLAGCLQLSAKGLTQGLTMSKRNAPLQEVFKDIEKQTGYQFFYKEKALDGTKSVTINVKNATLEQVLQTCFKDQPVTYNIVDKIIVVTSKQATIPNEEANLRKEPPPVDIGGRISDEDGKGLFGASVIVKGTKLGTTTDELGHFNLLNIANDAFLEISFVGFEKLTISVASLATNNVLVLHRKNNPLDEIQVEGYRNTNRRFGTGNIGTVKAKDIEKQPVSNPLLALQGRVPGLFITQTSGLPGTGVQVRIQGQNSIAKGNDPLYVIDGVPYVSQLLRNLAAVSGRDFGNPLNYINPSDIESIDVLKDADATSIYGSRAANGAILITTKRGKAGQTKVDINVQQGQGKVTRKLNLLNTPQYLEMRRQAISGDGLSVDPNLDYDLTLWDTTRYTNWQKELIGGTANYTNINATISGGNLYTQYLIGSTYHRETTVFPGDFEDQKNSVHFSINNISPNQKFQVQFSGNYLLDNNHIPQVDLTQTAIQMAPDAPEIYNSDGSLNWAPDINGNSTWQNPLSFLYQKYRIKTNNLIANSTLSYRVLPGLEIKSSFGYTNLQSNEMTTQPLLSVFPEQRSYTPRTAQYANNNITSWLVEPQASYRKIIGKGKFEALVGYTFLQNNSNGEIIFGQGYNSDLVMEDMKSAASLTIPFDATASIYKYNAFFSRINYTWDDKYILNLNARRDGSSRFGANNLYHSFGSIATAWIFSKEKFVQNALNFVSYGKLKFSYGSTGSDQIGDYQFMSLFSPPSGIIAPYQGAIGLQPVGLPNPYLQWEETKKLQLGLDLGVLRDRIILNTTFYRNRSSNQLISYSLPFITGFGSINRNFPATVENSGWELSLNSTNILIKNFSWSSNFNLTVPRNKLLDFPDLATSTRATSLVIGQPITITKVYHLLGVDPTTGQYQFADSYGGATFSPNGSTDKTVLINTAPKFYGGFQNNFRYKGLELDILFQFVKQTGLNYFFGFIPGFYYGQSNLGNQPTSVSQSWKKPGDKTPIQRNNTDFSIWEQFSNASAYSDAAYTDASYIRLKNLSLSWQLPKQWTKKAKLQGCSFYIAGQNLLTITNYIGMDPENKSTLSLPPLKVWTAGFHITL